VGGSRAERYLAHLDRVSGRVEPRFTRVASTQPGLHGVTVMSYDGVPEPGMLTAITYGLSLAEHPEWRDGKAELAISVRSLDPAWGLVVGHLAETLRGECPFAYGDTINLGEPVEPGSALDAFVVFAPAVLGREDYLGIDVGDALPVNIQGVYPIHQSERAFIHDQGLEAFWTRDWDPYDVTRPPAV
jgi:hypothetical protein